MKNKSNNNNNNYKNRDNDNNYKSNLNRRRNNLYNNRFKINRNRNNDVRKTNFKNNENYTKMFIPKILNIGFKNSRQTKNQNNNRNSNRYRNYKAVNKNKRIVDLILNPYKMALSNEFYSIFPSQSKVIKFSIYANYNILPDNDDKLMWFPYGIGFRSTMEHLRVHETQDSSFTITSTRYFNIIHKHGVNMELLPAPLSEFKGKYRIIGATLKITNTTPLNARGGTFFIANNLLDNPIPGYSVVERININQDIGGTDTNYDAAFEMDYNNVPVKANFSGIDVVVINEINNKNGNNIFSSSDEFLSSRYNEESDAMISNLDNSGATGINSKYIVKFSCNDTQSYLLETWTIVELSPDPGTGVQSLAIDSSKGVSKRISNIIDTTNHIYKL